MNKLYRTLLSAALSFLVAALCALALYLFYANAQLPSVTILEDVELQVPLRIYTSDGKLIGEYGEKRRNPISLKEVPPKLVQAILATEDRRFYEHSGVDIRGLARASVHLIIKGRKDQGASTITMQVARNFFLTRKKTFTRKINEILLAIKIERNLPKDRILELYLNKIYFGKRAYGVAAAAEVYYGKDISKLTLPEIAMLAGLPQAPSAINPLNDAQAALKRRNHVLKRMNHYGFITDKEYDAAIKTPETAKYYGSLLDLDAPFVAERARQEVIDLFGSEVYTSGYTVHTTVDSRLQDYAEEAVHKSLLSYDKRHGYRGPVQHLAYKTKADQQKARKILADLRPHAKLVPALVVELLPDKAKAVLSSGQTIYVHIDQMRWARPVRSNGSLGAVPSQPKDILKLGDIIHAEPLGNTWILSQYPKASAALVALKPSDGKILALVGGFDFYTSSFNRATQALRQPGSNFKPFIYAAALENGISPGTVINDAPLVFNDASLEGVWRPQNDSKQFYGPTLLRTGLSKSRNLVTIRLLKATGIRNATKILEKFGFDENTLPHGLALALGTLETTPLKIASGYAVFANGGYQVTPHILSHIKNKEGKVVYTASNPRICASCEQTPMQNAAPSMSRQAVQERLNDMPEADPFENTNQNRAIAPQDALDSLIEQHQQFDDVDIDHIDYRFNYQIGPDGHPVPQAIHTSFLASIFNRAKGETTSPSDNRATAQQANNDPAAKRILSPETAFIISTFMQDVIKSGTGRRAQALGRNDLAGKTGTTNNHMDAWFSGFNADLVATTWIGFDEPKPLDEYGSEAALPMWMDFMGKALKGKPESKPVKPSTLVEVKIDPETGLLARPTQANAVIEYFKQGDVPTEVAPVSFGSKVGSFFGFDAKNENTDNADNGKNEKNQHPTEGSSGANTASESLF
jgi:penicillin-binding protein 1A